MFSYMRPYHAPNVSRTDANNTDLNVINADECIEILISTAVFIMENVTIAGIFILHRPPLLPPIVVLHLRGCPTPARQQLSVFELPLHH